MMTYVLNHWVWLVIVVVALAAMAADPQGVAAGIGKILRLVGSWPADITYKVQEWTQAALKGLLLFEPATSKDEKEAGEGDRKAPAARRSASWLTRHCLGLLVHVVLAGGVALGAYALESLRGALVQIGVPAGRAPIPLWLAIAFLLTGVPALVGSVFFEGAGWMPEPYRLFPEAKTGVRSGLFWVGVVGMVTSLWVGFNVWVTSGVILQLGQWPLMTNLLNATLGPLTIVTLAVCGFIILLGLPSVLAIPVGALWLSAEIVHVLSSKLQELVEAIAEHVVPQVVKVLSLPGQLVWGILSHLWAILCAAPLIGSLLRARPPTGENDQEQAPEDEFAQLKKELKIGEGQSPAPPRVVTPAVVSLEPKSSLMPVGRVGQGVAAPFLAFLGPFGGKGKLEMVAHVPLDEMPDAFVARMAHKLGAWQVGLSTKDIGIAKSLTSTRAEFESLLFARVGKKVGVRMPTKASSEELLVLPMDIRRVGGAREMLTSLRFESPSLKPLLVLELPLGHPQDAQVQEGLAEVERLWNDQLVLGGLVYDQASPLMRAVGQARQVELLAKTLAGLCVAHWHYPPNGYPVEELVPLTHAFPLLVLSVGSCALLPGPLHSSLDPARWATKDRPLGRGDLPHVVAKTQELIYRVSTDPHTRTVAVAEHLLADRPRVFVLMGGFGVKDPRFRQWLELVGSSLGSDGPTGRPVFLGGTGCPDNSVGAKLFAQAGCLQGLFPAELGSGAARGDTEAKPRGGRRKLGTTELELVPEPPEERGLGQRRVRPQMV